METATARIYAINVELMRMEGDCVSGKQVDTAFSLFGAIWDVLHPKEQSRIAHLVLERVDYGGQDESISISFNPSVPGRNPL